MTYEQLNTGLDLSRDIAVLKDELKRWKRMSSFTAIYGSNDILSTISIKDKIGIKILPFDIIKTIAISSLETHLTELKNQFEKL